MGQLTVVTWRLAAISSSAPVRGANISCAARRESRTECPSLLASGSQAPEESAHPNVLGMGQPVPLACHAAPPTHGP